MKKFNFSCCFALFLLYGNYYNKCFAYLEHVHQYLVKQAYYFLENDLQCEITDLRYNIGLNYHGKEYVPKDNIYDPWHTYFAIGIGSWREDIDDPVWAYSLGNALTPSVTHFWDADKNDDYEHSLFGAGPYQNAWTKARVYYNGNYLLFIPQVQTGLNEHGNPIVMNGRFYSYNSLIDLFKTGRAYYRGYQSSDNVQHIVANNEIYFSSSRAHSFAYLILGRIAHLLGDMSVPSHAHADAHPCPLQFPDWYELYTGGSPGGIDCSGNEYNFPAQQWNWQTAQIQGGLIDEVVNNIDAVNGTNDIELLRYLFYTTNQLADFFPGRSTDGDNNLPNGTNNYLTTRYSALGNPRTELKVKEVADETFNYAIRATATLFYWFALRTNQFNDGIKTVNCFSTTGPIELSFKNTGDGTILHDYNNPLEIIGLANATSADFSISGPYLLSFVPIPYITFSREINISNPQNTIWWDGKDPLGNEAPAGFYTATLNVSNYSNSTITVQQYFYKNNSSQTPTILPNTNPYQSIKKPPLSCCVLDALFTNETFITDQTLNENIFQARNTLTLDNVVIPSGSNVVFKAKDEIVLKPGTIVEAGSNATFSREECTSAFLPACSNQYNFLFRKARPTEDTNNLTANLTANGTITPVPPKTLNNLITQQTSVPQNPVWLKLSIYNSMGQKLYELKDPGEKFNVENLKSGNTQINLPQGLYFFYFSNEQEGAVRKVVKL